MNKILHLVLGLGLGCFGSTGLNAQTTGPAQIAPDRTVLPMSLPPFGGRIGETYKVSTPDWPKLPTPPQGAPNVVIILLDDVGYGQTSTFGGPVPTPALDALAAEGLRYTAFHTTAICGPSRAALITGRNHHNSGSGFLAEWATGYPSYDNLIPRSTATIGSILKYNGYSTAWFGKNHNTPDWESSVVGPFDRWPTGLGFDYFYGFIGGETNQYYPVLFENTTAVEPAKSPAQGYHFMTDMTDKAIGWMRYSKSVAPQKPVLLYFAPGAAHAPHQPPTAWRDKFKGQFDAGWDAMREATFKRQLELGVIPPGTKLTARPDWARPWDSLTDTQRKVYAAFMENFAGYLAFTDHEVGRLLDAVHALPDGDNTLVIYIVGDNGASSEGGFDGTVNEVKIFNGFAKQDLNEIAAHLDALGGPKTEPHYQVEWAWAGNAPFQWVKQVASHLGGARNPMVVSWPARIREGGGVRPQFTHLIDVLPTVLEAAHLPAPKEVDGIAQKPMDGVSFLSTFDSGAAPEVRTRQYFEVFSNRSIYDKGWKANAQHTLPWRQDYAPGNWEMDRWELYNLKDDYSEAIDLAQKMPDKLKEMKALFQAEAQKYHVYPLDDRGAQRLLEPKPTPSDPNRTHFVYYAGATRLAETAAPNTKNKSHSITAKIDVPQGGAEGIIVAEGGISSGFALFLRGGKLVYHYNWFDEDRSEIVSTEDVPAGKSTVRMDFTYDGAAGETGKGGTVTLFVNDRKIGSGPVHKTVPGRFGIDTFGIGEDSGAPVADTYDPPYRFTGTIDEVVIDLK